MNNDNCCLREIAQKLHVTKRTVDNVLKKYSSTGSVKDQPGRGRKRKLSYTEKEKMVKKAKGGKDAPEIAREYSAKRGRISERTVQRALKEEGLSYLIIQETEALTEKNRKKRLKYAKENRRLKWSKVLFSDEKTFHVGGGSHKRWQDPQHRLKREVFRHPKKLHVWAAAGYFMKSKLFFFTKNLDSDLYQEIIENRLAEKHLTYASDCPKSLRKKWKFLQDNSRIHKAGASMEKLEDMIGNRLIEHPPQSPDLNIVEDIWSHLNRKVQEKNITDIEHLKSTLQREWQKLSFDVIRASVNSMPTRLKDVKNLHGRRTNY